MKWLRNWILVKFSWLLSKYPVGYCSSARILFIGSGSGRTRLGRVVAEQIGRWCRDVREKWIATRFFREWPSKHFVEHLVCVGVARANVVAIWVCPSMAEEA